MEDKNFGMALIIWFFTGGIGGHKVYIEEKFHYIFWYWAFTLITFGLAPLIGAFKLKGRIQEINLMNSAKNK